MKNILLKGAIAILLPILSGLWITLYNFMSGYLELKASVATHFEADDKKDASIENRLESMDNKLDILLMSRSQLNKKLERIINDNGDK